MRSRSPISYSQISRHTGPMWRDLIKMRQAAEQGPYLKDNTFHRAKMFNILPLGKTTHTISISGHLHTRTEVDMTRRWVSVHMYSGGRTQDMGCQVVIQLHVTNLTRRQLHRYHCWFRGSSYLGCLWLVFCYYCCAKVWFDMSGTDNCVWRTFLCNRINWGWHTESQQR